MQKVGLTKDYKNIDPFYRNRGIATHKAIELHLKGTLDPTSLDPIIQPHFEAFRTYWEKRIETIVRIEEPLVDATKAFAGTPDLVTEKAIFDWKCSKSHDRVADLQGQAYKIMDFALKQGIPHKPFLVVELHEDGTFEEFDYGPGYEEWSSVMALYRWKVGKHEETKV